MAFETIISDLSGTYSVDSTDTVTLLEGVNITSAGDGMLSSGTALSNARINVLGTIVAGGDGIDFANGITISTTGYINNTITVGQSGTIYAAGFGITTERGNQPSDVFNYGLISSGDIGIQVLGFAGGRIENHGTIVSEQYSAISTVNFIEQEGHYDVVNTGLLSGNGMSTNDATLRILNGTINNSGTIVSAGGEYAVLVVSVGELFNSGTIHGGVYGGSTAFSVTVRNSGTILGKVVFEGGIGSNNYYIAHGDATVDYILGHDARDNMFGGNADESFSGGGNTDRAFGMGGHDALYGGDGDDSLYGGAGDDELYGDANDDLIRGGSGDDLIDGGSGGDDIRGESGDDTISGGTGEDTIDGGSGEENINGGSNADQIFGRSGDDFIRGDSGGDSIGGGSGDDTISGGTGHDSIDGGSGGDRIFGGANDDTLEGTLGDDYLDGGADDDILRGGSDNDTLIGGSGQDTLSGGNGADTFVFDAISDSPHGPNRDEIIDFEAGIDVVDLSGFAGTLTFVTSYTGAGNEVRYNDTVGRLYIDIDGDSASDFSVDLGAGAGLTAGDLIL